jgi:tetratricopeptide (TPR) repeat protein
MRMKLSNTLVAATLIGGFLSVATSVAMADERLGESAANNCAQAANSHNDLLPFAARGALASCDAAINGHLTAKGRTAALINRGIVEAAAGKIDMAISDYNDVISRRPELASVYIDRGSALLRVSRVDEARADFDHAISLHSPDVAVAYYDRGMANEKLGNVHDAYHDYKQALSLSPNFRLAADELARFQVVSPRVASN